MEHSALISSTKMNKKGKKERIIPKIDESQEAHEKYGAAFGTEWKKFVQRVKIREMLKSLQSEYKKLQVHIVRRSISK